MTFTLLDESLSYVKSSLQFFHKRLHLWIFLYEGVFIFRIFLHVQIC